MGWMKINDRRVRVSEIVEYKPEQKQRKASRLSPGPEYVPGDNEAWLAHYNSLTQWMIVLSMRDGTSHVRHLEDEADRDAELAKLDAKFLPEASDDPYRERWNEGT